MILKSQSQNHIDLIMALEQILAVIARGALIPVFGAMMLLFWRRYKSQSNKFFYGYFLFFLSMTIVNTFVFIGELLGLFEINTLVNLMTLDFPYHDENREKLWIFYNLVRPPYLLALVILYFAMGSQVQPLEFVLNHKQHLLSRGLFLSILLTIPIYFPAITYTIYTPIVVGYSMVLTIFGFLGNIGINLNLAIKSPGEIRRRSLLVLLGFFLFVLGLLWSLKMGWSELIYSGWNFNTDVILGSVIMLCSALCYFMAFRKSD
jgi:hypothetical protein